jgi:coenzyme F420-reducing hydrogenase alpha subunit
METPQKQFASMHEVVMKKSELITKLIKNKATHDVILATAIDGYWTAAKQQLKKKKVEFKKLITEYTETVNRECEKVENLIKEKESLPSSIGVGAIHLTTSLGLVYPQDHSRDYDKAIRMMQASIYDEVKLSESEFDAYVLNNWEWKNNFIASNSAYIGKNAKYSRVSSQAPQYITGSYANMYSNATRDSFNMLVVSGMAAF